MTSDILERNFLFRRRDAAVIRSISGKQRTYQIVHLGLYTLKQRRGICDRQGI